MSNKEYIERGALLKKLFPYDVVDKKDYAINAKSVNDTVENAPAADVVEVMHGEWIRKDGFLVCSECDATKPYAVLNDTINYWRCDYCNRCGAKMYGERKEQT